VVPKTHGGGGEIGKAVMMLDTYEDGYGYYREMRALDHATLRRLWITEGKRRGYVLEDCDG
jgi:hypothetical protein